MLPRKIISSSIYNDPVKLSAYIKLLFMARFRECTVDGIELGVNQLLSTKPMLAKAFGVDERKARSILECFEKAGGIRTENYKNRMTLITLLPPFLYTDGSERSQANKEKPNMTARFRSENGILRKPSGKPFSPDAVEDVPAVSQRSEEASAFTADCENVSGVAENGESVCADANREDAVEDVPAVSQRSEEASAFTADCENVSGAADNGEKVCADANKEDTVCDVTGSDGAVSVIAENRESVYAVKNGGEKESSAVLDREAESADGNKSEKMTAEAENTADRRDRKGGYEAETVGADGKRQVFGERSSELCRYGHFQNVLMTAEEYEQFKRQTRKYEAYINKFSAYLASRPDKRYENHYAQLCIHLYEDEKTAQCDEGNQQYRPPLTEASYDIKRAEERARTTVPRVKKRQKR